MGRRWPWLLVMMPMLLPVAAHAQKTQLTVSGYPIAFPSPTAADYTAGFITSTGSLLFTVDATSGNSLQRTTSVSIRCAAPCPATGTKPLNTLQWQRPGGPWTTLTTTNALVESRAVLRGLVNDPWSNTIDFRFTLGWTTDPPSASANTYNIILTLTVTVP